MEGRVIAIESTVEELQAEMRAVTTNFRHLGALLEDEPGTRNAVRKVVAILLMLIGNDDRRRARRMNRRMIGGKYNAVGWNVWNYPLLRVRIPWAGSQRQRNSSTFRMWRRRRKWSSSIYAWKEALAIGFDFGERKPRIPPRNHSLTLWRGGSAD